MSAIRHLVLGLALAGSSVIACAPAAPTPTAAPAKPATAPTTTSAAAPPVATTVPAPNATGGEKVNIRFSFKANGQYAPFYLAVDKGFFAEQGLDVDVQEGTGGAQVMQTVAAGQDFMVTPGLDILVTARGQGSPVKAVAVLQQSTPAGIGVLGKSGIQKPSDLAGKRVVTSPGSTSYTLLQPYLKAIGVSSDSVNVINVEARTKIPALLDGKADAATVFGNDDFIGMQEQDPSAKFFAYGDVLDMYGIGLVVKEDTIKNKPDIVRKLVQAVIKAHVYAADHPDEAIDSLFKHVELPDSKASHLKRLNESLKLFKATQQGGGCLGCMTDGEFQKMEELLTQYGGLDKKAGKMSDYYTNEFVK